MDVWVGGSMVVLTFLDFYILQLLLYISHIDTIPTSFNQTVYVGQPINLISITLSIC